MVKLTMLIVYLRIFPSKVIRRLLWGTMVFLGFYGFAFFITGLMQCAPRNYFWLMWDGQHEGRCININALGWANAIISIVLDLWILALPLSQLRSLRMHWKKKLAVALMFIVGTL